MNIAIKRISKDILIINKSTDDLKKRGIYFHFNEDNILDINILIIPIHKEDISNSDLKSPYTDGFFLFKLAISHDFPLSPPKVTFHPQQNMVRLHPNYYETGKVCLSVVNTWANHDWTPSMSLLSLANVLEERFNERGLCFEPSRENEELNVLKTFNECVEYSVYKICVQVIEGKYKEFDVFKDIIHKHWNDKKNEYIERLERLQARNIYVKRIKQPIYSYIIDIDYASVLSDFRRI